MKNNRFVAAVLIPALALLTMFIVLPIMGSFYFSLFDYNPLRSINTFLFLDNYKRLLNDPVFIKSFKNTIFFVLVTVGINIALTLMLANFIAKVERKWLRNLFLVCIFLPCVAPVANSAVIWSRSLFPTRGGLLNLITIAIADKTINWVGSPLYLMPALILFTVWVDIGYNTVLFTAGIDGIPKDFYEAADIDGAGPFSRFFNITLPLLGLTFTFVSAMTLISHFQMFAQFEIIARNGGPGRAGQVLTTYIYYAGFRAKDMGYASAISVMLFLLILVVTLIQQRTNRVDWRY
jgi:multiple sugar transport system permease protein/raffinose/stachyose/melibiose transport system permease protein